MEKYFSTNEARTTRYPFGKNTNPNCDLILYTKINLKLTIDISVKAKTGVRQHRENAHNLLFLRWDIHLNSYK